MWIKSVDFVTEAVPIVEKLKLKSSPLSIYSHLSALPYSFFLDSALSTKKLGRYSFIGIEPFLIFKSKKNHITLDWMTKRQILRGNPFSVLKKLFMQFRIEQNDNISFPFVGGGVGYFSYDLKDFVEKLPECAVDELNIPDLVMCFYDTILAFDHCTKEFFIVSTGFPEEGRRRLYRQRVRLERLRNRIFSLKRRRFTDRVGLNEYRVKRSATFPSAIESNFTKDLYIKAILKAKEYIKRGDIYQVNLSQRFKINLDIEPFYLYRILRDINPAPFSAFLNFGEVKIVSASPERFLRIENRLVQTRPIKGTRPRGRDIEEDLKLKTELISSVKDRAENLMIIDLERNDLGRICKYGSVRVTEFMTCEEYATVFHLVSTVEGKIKDGLGAIDCLISCFPGGSITGAPKIRSMEIIEELEPVKRSIYTGSIGYISFNGNMDTSIVIRTILIKGREAFFHVGGGIVYDSDPEQEYQETLDKAKALVESIAIASLNADTEVLAVACNNYANRLPEQ